MHPAVSAPDPRSSRGPETQGTPLPTAPRPKGRHLRARSPGGGPGRTQRDPAEEGDAVQRPGRGAEEHARVAEEVRGVLAQAAGRPYVVEAQEAAARKGQAPAALGVVHGGGGSESGSGSGIGSAQIRSRYSPRRQALWTRPGSLHQAIPGATSAPPPSGHANEPAGGPMGG
ncbi:hypothetical protein P7K49_002365, partial [Saguinus oedipus]